MASTVNVDEGVSELEGCDLKNVLAKDLFVKLLKAAPTSSIAWNYFGSLYFKEPSVKIVASVQKRVFCKVCFEETAETTSFNVGNVKSFSATTSTSNLFSHLDNEHKICISSKSSVESTNSVKKYFNVQRNVSLTKSTEKKFILIRDLVLLCCRDLLPFNLVDGTGLRDFLEKYQVTLIDVLPDRTSISKALRSVYDDCKLWIVIYLKANCPEAIAITFDMWSCKYRRRSYITLTLHFVSKEFELINLTLSTSHFPDSHKGVNILPRVESILDSYGLSDKDISMVTDTAGNMNTSKATTRHTRYSYRKKIVLNYVLKNLKMEC